MWQCGRARANRGSPPGRVHHRSCQWLQTRGRHVLRAVEEHDRHADGKATLCKFGGERDGRKDDPVDLVVHQIVDDAIRVDGGVLAEEDEDMVADLLKLGRYEFDGTGIEVVFEIGDDEPDDAALAGLSERARMFGR